MMHFVHLAPSARRFGVDSGETILAAGLRQGLALPFGCQSGSCGSCRVRLLAGKVEIAGVTAKSPRALSDAEIQAGYILMCQTRPLGDLELLLHQPEGLERLRPRPWTARVIEHRALSHDVVGLWLQLPAGEPFHFLPGQYVDFLLPEGRRRSFSIASAEAREARLEFHLRVTPGGRFAHYVRDEMPERTLLRFEGPLGAFYLRENSDRPVLLMAGGTGFAPIKAMLERQFLHGGSAGVIEKDLGSPALALGAARLFHLFWGARAQRDLYLDSLTREWAVRHSCFRYTPVLSEPDTDWASERGFVHEAVLRTYPRLNAHEIYMTGPPAMVHAGKQAFLNAGLDADHLFYDSFDYAFETWPSLG